MLYTTSQAITLIETRMRLPHLHRMRIDSVRVELTCSDEKVRFCLSGSLTSVTPKENGKEVSK